MEYSFINDFADKKLFLKNDVSGINPFLAENNIKQLDKLYGFFKSGKNLMLINGYIGTGKSSIVRHFLTFLNSDSVILKYNCYETTILDDILLAFFEEFKDLAAQNKIETPKSRTENFVQKISAYFHSIEKPIVIVIDSFEEVLKDNKSEILDFLKHLSNLNKVKIILTARVFDYEDFENNYDYETLSILALEKPIFEKYLRANNIKLIGPVSDELYKYSRGYFFYTTLAINVIKMRNLNLFDFLAGYTKSFLSYNDFILREALSFVDPVSGHLFRFLTIMRHPVSIKLLKTLNLFDEVKISFFIENMILSLDGNMIYLQDYYKKIAENSIPENVAVKLHKSCVDLYNTQLPLRPLERDLLISRGTMRTEIEYHSMFIPKKPVINPVLQKPLSQESGNEQNSAQPQNEEEPKEIKNISFIFGSEENENIIMEKIADSINEFISFSDEQMKEIERENSLSLVELINLAKEEENKYNYKRVVMIYQRALTMNFDDDYYTFLPLLYSKLAQNYGSLSDWYNSLKYYEEALNFYSSSGDKEKAADIKLDIANIYYITFKRDKAKILLDEVIQTQGLSCDIYIKAYIQLADLSADNLNVSYDYLKRSVDLAEDCNDKKLLAELYYKFGVMNEEMNETKQAVIYYKKCTEIDKKINQYLSGCYSNLALIYDEAGSPDAASKFFEESIRVDEENKNINGIYISSLKLAELNRKIKPEYALKFYLRAFTIAHNSTNEETKKKIKSRIDDIKVRLGIEKFEELEKEYTNV